MSMSNRAMSTEMDRLHEQERARVLEYAAERARRDSEEFVNDGRVLGGIAGHLVSWALVVDMAIDTTVTTFNPWMFALKAFAPMIIGAMVGQRAAEAIDRVSESAQDGLMQEASLPSIRKNGGSMLFAAASAKKDESTAGASLGHQKKLGT